MPHKPEIIVDAERMRYKNSGLYYYCLHLSKALILQQHLHAAQLGFYVPKPALKMFDPEFIQIMHHTLHKFMMPHLAAGNVWHSTFQGSNYFPTKRQNKIVLTIHDINFFHEKVSYKKQKKYSKALQHKINIADRIIVISEFVKKDILNNFSVDEEKINVVYNGCNISNASMEKPVIIPSSPFIFTIGIITEKKNFHVLPALLLNNNYTLIIAGDILQKEYKAKIEAAAKNLNVQERLIFTGPVSEAEKHWYLKNCLLFAFPSLAEGFGLPVIEAMHFGKPVLLSKATSLPEIGGEKAFYFDNFEHESMNNKMENCLNHYTKFNDKEEIIEWSKRFSWKTAAEKHWQIYEDLLNN